LRFDYLVNFDRLRMRKYFLFIFFTFVIWPAMAEYAQTEGTTIGDAKQREVKNAARSALFTTTDRLGLFENLVLIFSNPFPMANNGAVVGIEHGIIIQWSTSMSTIGPDEPNWTNWAKVTIQMTNCVVFILEEVWESTDCAYTVQIRSCRCTHNSRWPFLPTVCGLLLPSEFPTAERWRHLNFNFLTWNNSGLSLFY